MQVGPNVQLSGFQHGGCVNNCFVLFVWISQLHDFSYDDDEITRLGACIHSLRLRCASLAGSELDTIFSPQCIIYRRIHRMHLVHQRKRILWRY